MAALNPGAHIAQVDDKWQRSLMSFGRASMLGAALIFQVSHVLHVGEARGWFPSGVPKASLVKG